MSEVKWIKITTNMFEDEKIDFIQSLPEADAIIVVWVRLLTLAGRCNAGGYIYLTENIPYTADMLAHKFRKPINTINLALETFRKLQMIEADEKGLYLPNWDKHQNIDGLDKIREQNRLRVARHRELKKIGSPLQDAVCQYCGNVATGYDHIVPTARGGKDIEDNKVLCCIECNRIKNDKPLIDFLNYNRERINDELIMSEPKLTRYVTLRNVTGHYEVTDGNAIEKEIDIEKDIYIVETEQLWSLYPNKQGKANAVKKIPKLIKEFGYEQLDRAVKRYIDYVEVRRQTDFKDLKFQNGSTFFNGGYVDYLDENFQEETAATKKSSWWDGIDS